MVALYTKEAVIGMKAIDFNLLSVDGNQYNLESLKGKNGLIIMFICNHCPYVKAIINKLVKQTAILKKDYLINSVAIMPNDPDLYPEDSFENMIKISKEYNFSFPYLIDLTQEVAKSYDAVCTPDFFGFDKKLELQYRGRFDDSGMSFKKEEETRSELFNAMIEIAENGFYGAKPYPSAGCSIKWQKQ